MTEMKPIDWVVQNTNLYTGIFGEKFNPTVDQQEITNGEIIGLAKRRKTGGTTAILSRLVYNLHNNENKTYLYYGNGFRSANCFYNQLVNILQSSGARFTKLAAMCFELENGCKMYFSGGNERDLLGFKFDEAFCDETLPPESLITRNLVRVVSID
jgi:hypothetical protein